MPLDLSSLIMAIESLERALKVSSKFIDESNDNDQIEVLRCGVIQNFEFTYELSWKFMKRWLEMNVGEHDVDGVTRKELFRLAAESHLIDDVEKWFAYHASRNEVAHTYDASKAQIVYESVKSFSKDARMLLNRITKKND